MQERWRCKKDGDEDWCKKRKIRVDELRRQQRQKGCKESGSLMEEEKEMQGGGREGVEMKREV